MEPMEWMAIAAAAGSILNFAGGQQSNAARQQMSEQQMRFQLYSALQSQGYEQSEAINNRNWQEGQRLSAQDFDYNQSRLQENFQREMVAQAQDYSTRMSSTAYQRAVQDMRAAGINPMLAYQQGGASAPIGQTASGSSLGGPSPGSGAMARGTGALPGSVPQVENTLSAFANTGFAALQAYQGLSSTMAQVEKLKADTALSGAAADLTRAQAATEANRPDNVKSDTGMKTSQAILNKILGDTSQTQSALNVARSEEALASAGLSSTRAGYEPAESKSRQESNYASAFAQGSAERLRNLEASENTPGARAAADRAQAIRNLMDSVDTFMKLFKGGLPVPGRR